MRSGTSQRTGNEWRALPFVFEYFEHESDRYPDSVMLETFDDKVIDNLKEGMEVRCGFGHNAKEITRQDQSRVTINEIRLYKIESVRKKKPETAQPEQLTLEQQAALEKLKQMGEQAATGDENGSKDDDLPF